ncbi:putative late blight resistance protein -like protein R1A-10-like [Capsicum annuum]|nr:putative late blight resistance protein -like protein R1A-10-like [Capsicum annuum]
MSISTVGDWSSCWSHVGSVFLIDDPAWQSRDLLYQIYTFKFLKVLNMMNILVDYFPTGLVYLRFFAAKVSLRDYNSIIDNSWKLEVLMLQNTNFSRIMPLPIRVRNMVKLRHLQIGNCCFSKELLENFENLYDLQTLSTPFIAEVQDVELILRKTPNLRILEFEIQVFENFQYGILNIPTRIEKLCIYCHNFRPGKVPKIIPFSISAPSLRSLTLCGFYLHHQHLSEIASLQNLQALRLLLIHFENEEWKVSNGEFLRLRSLKLQLIESIKEWRCIGDDAFPQLERLVLHGCPFLKEIPSCFEDISSLLSIELWHCNESVVKSARVIQETQVEDYQNSGFQVFIHDDHAFIKILCSNFVFVNFLFNSFSLTSMAIGEETRSRITTTIVIDTHHPLYLHACDTPGSSLVSFQLTGPKNYALWSRLMRIRLLGKSKMGFVDGRYTKGKFDLSLHDLWEKRNLGRITSKGEGSDSVSLFSYKGNHGEDVQPRPPGLSGKGSFGGKKDQLICDYFKWKGHTKDHCYKFHGYPSDYK